MNRLPGPAGVADLPRWTAVPAVVAAFDVDGTLTTRDCVVPFLRRVAGTLGLVVGFVWRAHQVVPALVRRDRDTLKAHSARVAFRGRSRRDIDAQGAAFAVEVDRRRLRADTVARLRWHQRQGHDVVLVSASFAVYLRPLAEQLGIGHVLATELAVDEHDRCTGELLGANCRGAEKSRRVRAWLDETHGGRALVTMWAYGDSAGDRELLADADHPVWAGDPVTEVPG